MGLVTKSAFVSVAAGAAALISLNIPAWAEAEWLEAKSPHFVVYGDMSEQTLRYRTERLERFDALMRSLFKVQDTVPVSVFVLPTMVG